ncbi:Uma2 family endonuclease [Desertifilum sp. FACHB-1129]|uniref:Putative restriction endonuclease domain-containing protein n=1 Tax=Desertifilum tharense IPPAS B-1220 TaxID=1781255 RepID=A0A1E5QK32_9CYAN|nr:MULTISPECIES: Uma2 family endonuclease [Desertifilum]MDA0211824.1 Uma2 family endonuclease [Cyanobacteria bacterium FC1]MBD2312053.1 Uma2 family endonuclease [Desertifilum sp. FACHB-1129]MBD2322506.1 Uma2 family endonuclease [Desertifilum sp. FACHB-866]MBD2332669.1 Uma2 family endonuclease [Desertifilum sp. FACHB-868]OEJ75049.1 hypothetical protein BH720_11305 [Desertifilum tharense IPPAS B-1220]
MIANPKNWISAEDYLEAEKTSPIKHEYIQGQVYAMAGASDAHVTISLNLAAMLKNHLRGGDCRVYITDMKAQIDSLNTYYYPDVMVTCDRADREFDYFKRHPTLIVEVVSPSTEAFDRGDKFIDYQTIETLTEYVLISQTRFRVDCFRRNPEGQWVLQSYSPGEEVYLASIDFRTGLDTIYEDVTLSETPPQDSNGRDR